MKKNLSDFANAPGAKALSKAGMKKVMGGGLVCGCLDVEGIFHPGPSGGGYCMSTYEGEPYCLWWGHCHAGLPC